MKKITTALDSVIGNNSIIFNQYLVSNTPLEQDLINTKII